jgi:hypothetical protein
MILLLISKILDFGVYDVELYCPIEPQTARQIIRDVIRKTNVDDFAYIGNSHFVMIIDVLAKRNGPVQYEEIESVLNNYCPNFEIRKR